MENTIIESIKIFNLFKNKDIIIDFSDKCTILIGENGIGKTTILLILNYIFKGQIEKLFTFQFNRIEVKLSNDEKIFSFDRAQVGHYVSALNNVHLDFDLPNFIQAEKIIFSKWNHDDKLSKEEFLEIVRENIELNKLIEIPNVNPVPLLFEYINENSTILQLRKVISCLDLEIIYLPTYRRIEADLFKVMETSLEHEHKSSYKNDFRRDSSVPHEIIFEYLKENKSMKFGMSDIKNKVDNLLSTIYSKSLKGYSKVANQIIKHLIWEPNRSIIHNFNNDEISIILARSGEYLNEKDKNRIIELVESKEIYQNQNLMFVIESLREIYRNQKKEDSALSSFATECNRFLIDKLFIYDKTQVKLNLYFKHDKKKNSPLPLDKLSSGEKQIISILANMYLNFTKNIVFLIDEPELSLSIYWQEELLPSILRAPSCKQLIAVTHSPFIFNNELCECALGASEYVIGYNKDFTNGE